MLGRSPEPAAEDAPVNPIPHVSWRPDHEELVTGANGDHLRTIVVRPGLVYGGGQGMVGELFKSAANGLVRVIGDGNNHWPLVYDRDLADLYVRLVAREDASGVYHANDEGDERVNDIVSAIAPYLPVSPDVRHVPLEEARAKMGTIADGAVARSGRAQPARAGARLDAEPAFGCRQRGAPARGVAGRPQLETRHSRFARGRRGRQPVIGRRLALARQ